MGPSGAGKSTLLNILAGYTKSGYEGRIAVDGMERCLDDFYNVSCYIMQDDQLHDLLTVREIMFTAASLKLGPKIDKKFKQTKISNILKGLGLIDSLDTRTGQLSGGQRKRLSIALELINNPPIMFFDEPTSGLDSSHSKQCIDLLKKLAADGRTVIMTVHQPSASMLFEADLVYCLSPGGRCSYAGSPHNIIHYMDRLHGLQCPSSHNPADFLIEVCSGEYGERTDDLVKTSKNGKNLDWRKKTPGWDNPIINSEYRIFY
ncbi:hypothetical protein AAG570_003688 [Ranatra chinensis]|uniref:ABC transporter domain-containing protein n=1 Tax=Ranatra chinensis TaxID=642074 RepID=A0ABD0Y4E6_9HEMI